MSRRVLAFLLATALLAACQIGPSPPLLSPASGGQDYGYSEKPLGEHRYAIDYLGPRRIASTGEAADRSTAAALQEAGDLALWRAAQLAKSAGYEGFRLTNKQGEVNTHPGVPYNTATPCGPFQSTNNTVNGQGLGGFAGDYSHSFAACNHAGPQPWIQAHASIEVDLVHAPGPDDYAADRVIRQMQQTYPGADHLPYEG